MIKINYTAFMSQIHYVLAREKLIKDMSLDVRLD
jgi:hypothetical protein